MKNSLEFPSTNPIGRVFNDFLNGIPLLSVYGQQGHIVEESEEGATICLGDDILEIIDDGFSVNYKTTSNDVYMEMLEFVTANMEYTETLGDSIILEHPSGVEIYFSQKENGLSEFLCSRTAGK
ncbi:MAG: hypothetical protein LUH22_13210 [Bacteroides sp.]|nr:hypothetical protein [Bacteroides sp.]